MFETPRLTVALIAIFVATSLAASEVAIFRLDERSEALEGEVDGVAVGAEGEIRLAPRFERQLGFAEPFLFSAAAHPEGGVVLGTGNDGKILRAEGDVGDVIAALEQQAVYAVHVRPDGEILAAGSPDGRVVRVVPGGGEDGAEGSVELVFDPEATYVWDLAEDAEGRLLVATGLPGRVYRLGESEVAEVLYESPDSHVRTLLPRPDGSILAGTAGQGLVVEIAADGAVTTLYDAGEPEVLAFASDGKRVWAALLASEASQVDLSAKEGEGEDVTPSGQETVGSRSGGYDGPRSRLVVLGEDGAWTSVADMDDQTIHALAVAGGELWLGTGAEGRLYRLEGEELILEETLDERQVMALLPGESDGSGDPGGLTLATTDSIAVYRWRGERRESGTFTSQVLDAGQPARFGVLRWWGEEPGGANTAFEVRSGMAAEVDATWGGWQPVPAGAGDGGDLAVGELLGVGRYVQWRARLERGSSASGPLVEAVELSYRQRNLAPEITQISVLDAGEILVPQSFNPTTTTFEPWSPNRDGIFTSLRQEKGDGQFKTLYKRGYRTLRWKAEDANGDALVYRLEVSPEGSDGEWFEVTEELEDTWFSFDSTVLPDGVYRFKVTAVDRPGNLHGDHLEAVRRSEPVIVDHTPPELVESRREGASLWVEVTDEHHPVRHAAYSVDAGEWQAAASVDGLLDGRRENLRLEVPADARLVLLRLTDAASNVVTLNLSND